MRFDILETGERLLDDIDGRQRTVAISSAQFLHAEKTDVLIRTGLRIIHVDSPFRRIGRRHKLWHGTVGGQVSMRLGQLKSLNSTRISFANGSASYFCSRVPGVASR